MGITNKYKRIPLSKIQVRREERQRQDIEVEDIKPSIARRGVIQPIIVEELPEGSEYEYLLIAGERRYTASSELGIPDIPARLVSDLTETERQILELEENVKRKDLPWKNEVLAFKRIHELYVSLDPAWTQENTATETGVGTGVLSVMLRVATELQAGNTTIEAAGGYRAAYNIISRRDDRLIDDAMNDLLSPGEESQVVISTPEAAGAAAEIANAAPGSVVKLPSVVRPSHIQTVRLPPADSIMNLDFTTWVQNYVGPPFSFIHCDFPYGINHDKSDQGGSGKQWEGYEDSEDTYWKLCDCLATNLDRIMTQSGHLMFWLSSDIIRQYETIKFFQAQASSLTVQTVPLYWHKTDNKGILPDPKRGPRRITETALIASRGDRLVVKSVSNTYGSPTTKEIHQSEKPEPMLRHFFQMFVDENTRMLDPTCGSGTSLRAAESLGATFVLGLEINPDFVEGARIALRKFRSLRAVQRNKENG